MHPTAVAAAQRVSCMLQEGGLGRALHARVRGEQQQAAGLQQQAHWRFGKRIFGMRPASSKVHHCVAAKGQVGDHWKVRRAINVAHDALTRQILCALMSSMALCVKSARKPLIRQWFLPLIRQWFGRFERPAEAVSDLWSLSSKKGDGR